MKRRTVVSGLTLTVLLAVLVGMALWGYRAATAPVDASSGSDDCSADERQVKRFLTRGDVQVSVYNAGRTSGLAGRTMDRFEGAGFRPGEIGNAPRGTRIQRAEVRTTEPDDLAAELVARAIGPRVPVRVVPDDLGPGVDVIVGDRLRGLATKAPDRLELAEPVEQCIEVD